ncbi:MAG: tetratricopeptide repeat protein [Bacteroidales bacterium]
MLTNQMGESKKYNLKALENLALENPKLVPEKASNVYNNCGGFYYTQKQFDSALYYLNLSAKSHEINHNQSQQVYVYHNMSIIYQEMGEYEIGKEYLQKAITLAKDTKLPYTQTICLQNLAYLYYEKKEYANSLIYYNQALDLAKKTNIPKIESSILIEMSDVFYQLNHFKKACEYKKEGILLGDSVFGNSKMDRIIALSQQFELYKIKTEKKLLSKKLLLSQISTSKKNIVLGILVTLLILLTIVTYFVIYKIKKQSEQNSQLEDQLACIHQEDNAKIQSISKKYEPIIEQKNRELTVNALFLIRVNDLLYKLKKNINQQLNAKDTLSRASFNKEMADILKSYNPNKGWEEFKLYFEQIHHSFYTKLNEINPNLSQMEERLCALLVLNMTTKEIADLTHRSERTIETIIYKIRKKLNIPPQEKTTLFLKKWVYHNDKPIKNNL